MQQIKHSSFELIFEKERQIKNKKYSTDHLLRLNGDEAMALNRLLFSLKATS